MFCPNCGISINDTSKFCKSCGSTIGDQQGTYAPQMPLASQPPISQVIVTQVYFSQPQEAKKDSGYEIMRMVVGIFSILLFFVITPVSCAVGVNNAISNNITTSGTIGFFVGLCILTAGIISVAARNYLGGAITAAFIYFIAGIMGSVNVENAPWAFSAFFFLLLILTSILVDVLKRNKVSKRINAG